jgi:hypothetical protein
MSGAQSPQHLEAVEIGQADVENDEVELTASEQLIGIPSRRSMLDRVVGPGEELDQALRQE